MPEKVLRGYLSFLLLIPLAFLLLLPLLSRSPPPSMAPFYASERTMGEQLAFKRALLVSAHQTMLSLQTSRVEPSELRSSSNALGCKVSSIPSPTPFTDLTSIEKECLARFEILRAWSQLCRDWSAHSDYTTDIQCAGLSLSDSASPGSWPPSARSPSWVACGDLLSYQRLTGRILLQSDLKVFLYSKSFGINAAGDLPKIEVGG